jgi:hypothetical protein
MNTRWLRRGSPERLNWLKNGEIGKNFDREGKGDAAEIAHPIGLVRAKMPSIQDWGFKKRKKINPLAFPRMTDPWGIKFAFLSNVLSP